jgi:hypothetical protein
MTRKDKRIHLVDPRSLVSLPATLGERIYSLAKSTTAAAPPSQQPQQQHLVLVLSGALCPVHRGHVQLLHAVRHVLESTPSGRDGSLVVAAGLLAPSSEDYLNFKLGPESMPLAHRVLLSEAALADDSAAAASSWLGVAPWGNASGSKCCALIEQQIAADPLLAGRFARLTAVAVYGTDFLIRCPGCLRKPTLIFARLDDDGTAEAAVQFVAAARARGGDAVHPDFRLLTSGDGTPPVPPVSSTLVRRLLARASDGVASDDGNRAAGAAPALTDILHPSVVELLSSRDQLDAAVVKRFGPAGAARCG